jgi:hypothetical protein
MTFHLEHGIPVPPRVAFGGKRGSKYPFAEMHVGHSFLAPADVKASTLRSAIGAYNKQKTGAKFAVRPEGNTNRVWRTE